jgi:hypothetical protein
VLGHGGLGLGEGGLEGAPVDGEEHVALFHVLAFLEMHFHELAAHLGLDRHHVESLDAADGLDLERHSLLLDGGHGHGHGGLRRAGPPFDSGFDSAFFEQAPAAKTVARSSPSPAAR